MSVFGERPIKVRLKGASHISFKFSVPLFQAPFENIADDQHADISGDFIKRMGQPDDSGIQAFLEIVMHCDDRIWTLGADQRI